MPPYRFDQLEMHSLLEQKAAAMEAAGAHLKHLLAQPGRLENFCARGGGLFLDFSRQRLDQSILDLLYQGARDLDLCGRFTGMCAGEKINRTEDRAVLHTACRNFNQDPIYVDGCDIMPDIRRVRDQIRSFSNDVHSGKLTGSTGKCFRHVVVIGIGGSYLGSEFVSTALEAYADKKIHLHYLSNVDIDNFGTVAAAIDPETTLWIIISKSYTTAETTANTLQADQYMRQQGLDPTRHTVTVTSQGSPGDDPSRTVLQTFHMFDFIGGRYSVTSAVGGVPLSLYLGYDCFERFLNGAAEMDTHALSATPERNLPMLAALISLWNFSYLGYRQQAIIPYAASLAKLAPHIQQLSMESNGKGVDRNGRFLNSPAGMVIFGEPGTNAQHSFFQLAHQGRPFPIDFIGVLRPHHYRYQALSKGVTNHQELWANMLAQAQALAMGRENTRTERHFTGNRPSSTLVMTDLSPENLGRLLSFYEARTVFEGFLWGVNSFDQYGVELGKSLAGELRDEMSLKNQDSHYGFDKADEISRFYLNMLFDESTTIREAGG